MGRHTWLSLPRKPLPHRRNIVITRMAPRELTEGDRADCFTSIPAALNTCDGDIWFIGGARIFEEAMGLADLLDLTHVPDRIRASSAVHFPEIDLGSWESRGRHEHEDDPQLEREIYARRALSP